MRKRNYFNGLYLRRLHDFLNALPGSPTEVSDLTNVEIASEFTRFSSGIAFLSLKLATKLKHHFCYQPSNSDKKGVFFQIIKSNQSSVITFSNQEPKIIKSQTIATEEGTYLLELPANYKAQWWLVWVPQEWYNEFFDFEKNILPFNFEVSSLVSFQIDLLRNSSTDNQSETSRLYHQFAFYALSSLSDQVFRANESNPVSIIKNYLLDNLEMHLPPMPQLAQICGISVSSLQVKFKQSEGQSINAYFSDQKMTYAQTLIETGLSVKETALRLGYANGSNFSNIYKKTFGISPSKDTF